MDGGSSNGYVQCDCSLIEPSTQAVSIEFNVCVMNWLPKIQGSDADANAEYQVLDPTTVSLVRN